jgi:hypothetical protein
MLTTPPPSNTSTRTQTARRPAAARLSPLQVHAFVADLLGEDIHATRVLSFAHGVVGVLHAAALGVHAIGRGLADAMGLSPKHAIKQVDRLLGNPGVNVWDWFTPWVLFVVAAREELVVALDWTEFDKDDHATIAMYLVTSHGRATPLVWKTVQKSTLKNRRNDDEAEVIARLHEILPETVNVTLLADRGFGDQKLFMFRDIKDNHFGMGLSATHIHSAQRRDRLLLLAAVAHALLTLLGAAGEACGLDRTLKANTVKTRTMSLYNQGCCWYRAIPMMREDRLVQLMTEFGRLLSEHAAFREIFGLI